MAWSSSGKVAALSEVLLLTILTTHSQLNKLNSFNRTYISSQTRSTYVQKCRQWRNWQIWRNFVNNFDKFGGICELVQILGRTDKSAEILPRLFTYHLNEYLNLPREVPKSWRIWRKWRIWWKWRIWRKWRFWRNFAKGVDEIFRVNILTCLKGSQKVGEFGGNGRFGKNGDSDEILPRVLTKSFD